MGEQDFSQALLTLAPVYLVPTSDGGYTVRGSRRSMVIRGKVAEEVFPILLPLLDGSRTGQEVAEALESALDAVPIVDVIRRLIDVGVIEVADRQILSSQPHGSGGRFSSQSIFWRQYGGGANTAMEIAGAHVLVAGDGPLLPVILRELSAAGVGGLSLAYTREVTDVDVNHSSFLSPQLLGQYPFEELRSQLSALDGHSQLTDVGLVPDDSVGWREVLGDVDLAVIVLDSPVIAVPWVEQFNRAALSTATAWLSCGIMQGATAQVGPSVVPGVTACWKCIEERVRSNNVALPRYDEFVAYMGANPPDVDQGALSSYATFVGALASSEALRLLVRGTIPVETLGSLLMIDLWDYTIQNHPVLKLPRCPDCGSASQVPAQRIWS
jgi:bacteriocin biosynthesis cyclodehydratase domain-containing protein